MRDTIDYGIDLGTTNSAGAVIVNGEVSVVKEREGVDFTPSAVWITASGDLRVGRRAREQAMKDPRNARAEFKLLMGLNDASHTFTKAGVTLTPPQLSAEVLKSLRDDFTRRLGEAPQCAVITVPAAFRLHQTNATSEAAALAGFSSTCPLIQEPTAAAFAYGIQNASADDCSMVFDLGGGTFDSAVVTTRDGELRVLNHAGHTHLGGKNIDWAIVDQLLVPAVLREHGFTDFTPNNPIWIDAFAALKGAAEMAKIDLSSADSSLIELDLYRGREEVGSLTYRLTRGEMHRIAEPFYVRAINLCRDALTEAKLHPSDIDRLLLVGGATLAPGLREMLADPREGLGIALDFSQDPSTVVARGAAIFAGTVPLERAFVAPSAGEFAVELDYPRSTSLTNVVVGGKVHSSGATDWTGYQVTLDNPTGQPPFRTPRIAVREDGTFVADVRLNELTTNTLALELVDGRGNRQKISPDTLAIRHWANEPAGPVLTNTIGVAQSSGRLERMVEKGTTLPAKVTKVFHTTTELRRADADSVVRIPIVEGERDRAERNLTVAAIEIRPHDVRIDLAKGASVEVTIEIDASRRVTAVADVLMVNEQFDAVADLDNVPTPDVDTLRYQLSEAETRLDRLRASARRSGSEDASRQLGRLDAENALETARNEVRTASTDAGDAAAAEQRLREIMADLDEVEDAVALPAQFDRIAEMLSDCREMIGRFGDASDRSELSDLERRLDTARADRDTTAAAELADRAGELQVALLKRDGNAFDVGMFYALREMEPNLTSRSQARSLIKEGEAAIAAQRWDALRGVNQRLSRLLPDDYEMPTQGGVVLSNGDM